MSVLTYLHLSVLLIMFSFHSSELKEKPFPEFQTEDMDGKVWSNQDMLKGRTLAVVLHIGCPGAMPLLNDLDSMKKTSDDIQVLVFFKNTREQIEAFFSTEESGWREIRNHYGVRRNLNLVILPQCSTPYLEKGEIMYGEQCRGISKKLKTRSSPSLFMVVNGAIAKENAGYVAGASSEERMKWLEDFTN